MKYFWLAIFLIVVGQEAHASCPRTVALAPNLTEIVFALGKGDCLVGVSEASDFPEAAKKLPRVGGYYQTLNLEVILSLHPELVLSLKANERQSPFAERLRRRGIEVLELPTDSLGDIRSAIRLLGERFEVKSGAARMIAGLDREFSDLKKQIVSKRHPTVALVIWRSQGALQDIYVAGGRGFHEELLEAAGGVNVFGDLPAPFPRISKESLVARNPEIIIDALPSHTEESGAQSLALWQRLPVLQAVQQGRVYPLNLAELTIPGPRVGEAARKLFEVIHGK